MKHASPIYNSLAAHIKPYDMESIYRSALFMIMHEAIMYDPEASFMSSDEMYDLAVDRVYKHGPTNYEVEAMLYYHYNHGFKVVYNNISMLYDMMPPASYKDEADIAKAMHDMYGRVTYPVTFA